MITAKSENSRNSSGSWGRPVAMSAWLKIPLRQRNGTQEIMRRMFDVQNGTVHSRNSAICADGAVSAVYRPVLGVEHPSHDFLGSVPLPQRNLQPGAHGHRPAPRAARVSAVLRFRGDHRLRAFV